MRQNIKAKLRKFLNSYYFSTIFKFLILNIIILIFSDRFFSHENIYSILISVALLGLLAMAECIVFIIGGIDLSIYSVYMLTGVVMTLFVAEYNSGFIPSVFVSILIGTIFGSINGFFVSKFKIQPIIITLGTMLIAKGAFRIVVKNISNYSFPKLVTVISEGKLYFFPTSFVIVIFIMVICYIILKRTTIGRQIFAIGGNEKAAQISGLKVDTIKIMVYTSSSILASLAGVIFCTNQSVSSIISKWNNDFEVILVVIIGGVGIYSRAGSIFRILLGTVYVVIIKNLLSMNSVADGYQILITGCLFIIFSIINLFNEISL